MPKQSRYPAPPASARYRCGFPGCSKRYASTDGVRKHARKAHNNWLKSVDDHSGLRDKACENKPSTYCIMECDENDRAALASAPYGFCPPVGGAPAMAPRVAEQAAANVGLGPMVPPPQLWQLPGGGNPLLEHSAFEMGRSLTLLNALAATAPLAPMKEAWTSFASLASFPPDAAMPMMAMGGAPAAAMAAVLAPLAMPPSLPASSCPSVAESPTPQACGGGGGGGASSCGDAVCTPATGPSGPLSYATPGLEGKTRGDLSPPPFELPEGAIAMRMLSKVEPGRPSPEPTEEEVEDSSSESAYGYEEAELEPPRLPLPAAAAAAAAMPASLPEPHSSGDMWGTQMSDEAFFKALLAL